MRRATQFALTASLALAVPAPVNAQDASLERRLIGGWEMLQPCFGDPAPGDPGTCVRARTGGGANQLYFGADGTATVLGPDVAYGRSGPSGIYTIRTRETPDGDIEMLLTVAGVDLGRLGFSGDTLVLSGEADQVGFVGDSLVMGSVSLYYVRMQEPIAQRLIGSWRFAKVCQYDVPSGVRPCSPIATPIEWLRFEADGTAEEHGGPDGPSGRYAVEVRDLPGGQTETLLTIAGRNMGQVSFVGDTLVLGMAYVDGADRYFVRMPEMPEPAR